MKRKKSFCIITGSRADYGIYHPLIETMTALKDISLKIIATGSHLSAKYGLTYKEIEADGYSIFSKVKLPFKSDLPLGVSFNMASALKGIASALHSCKPDAVILLGDRYEMLAAACAAMILKIPIAHIHGGERSEGAIDEAFRHAITKMSALHFTATEEYRRRVIQMGENPSTVHCVGALALDSIAYCALLSKSDLEKRLSFSLKPPLLLVTFHPETLENQSPRSHMQALFGSLDNQHSQTGARVLITYANADAYGKTINAMIERYVFKRKSWAIAFPSLGYRKYLSLMRFSDAVIGNSSSGIIEAPSFKIGTINIGDRQRGRIKAESIIDCSPTKRDIDGAFAKLYSTAFQKTLKSVRNPYGVPGASLKIVKLLSDFDPRGNMKKRFFDFPIDCVCKNPQTHSEFRTSL